MAKLLSEDECKAILTAYGRMFLTFSRLEAALGKRAGKGDAPYIKEAMHDLIGSVGSLLTATPNYGQSKWSSLQAVEKVIKSCIREKNVIPKKLHSLADLYATALQLGAPQVDPALLSAVQCAPDVRYDSTLVQKMEALEAHYAALTVCVELADVVKRTTASSEMVRYEIRTSPTCAFDALMLCYAPSAPLRA
jgi:hypothetical protein